MCPPQLLQSPLLLLLRLQVIPYAVCIMNLTTGAHASGIIWKAEVSHD